MLARDLGAEHQQLASPDAGKNEAGLEVIEICIIDIA